MRLFSARDVGSALKLLGLAAAGTSGSFQGETFSLSRKQEEIQRSARRRTVAHGGPGPGSKEATQRARGRRPVRQKCTTLKEAAWKHGLPISRSYKGNVFMLVKQATPFHQPKRPAQELFHHVERHFPSFQLGKRDARIVSLKSVSMPKTVWAPLPRREGGSKISAKAV